MRVKKKTVKAVPLKNVNLLCLICSGVIDVLKTVTLGKAVFCHLKNAVFRHLHDLNSLLYGFWRLVKRFTCFFQLPESVCE
ncbi:hypothetical protein IMSAG025_02115 [Muribaculaceae bacterium]|nr:hypothetical protein IMSAG025_02115 [Muribaculaceae bacterium]